MDWLTLVIGVILIALGIFYYRRAEVSAEETSRSKLNWRLSPNSFRVMAIIMILAGAMDLGALIVLPLLHGGQG